MLKNMVLVCLVALLCYSCANKAQTGALGGAAGGALLGQMIGRDTGATLLGAALGGLIGYVVGNEMDKQDRVRLNNAYETTPSYNTSSWVNPDTGNQYAVTPQPAYTAPDNRICRKAEIEAVIDGKKETTEALACRENGHWVIQQ